MNLLEFFFIISWVIILILSFDIAKKQKFNALHFLVFIWIWGGLLIFTFFPEVLKLIWNIFWLARGADVLVYTSIVFLLYFVLLLLTKHVSNRESITDLIREIAISNSSKKIIEWKEVFLIPAYNEWKIVYKTVNNILKNGYSNILVINDWSKDDTKTYLEKFWNKIVLLNHYKNRWQWASLGTWLEYIRRYWKIDYIITFDSDWQHSLDDMKNFEKALNKYKNVDIFLGSRFLWKKQNKIPFIRKIILKLGILFTFFLSKINLSDTHNWYRVIRKRIINKIKITQDGMTHASEILDIISSEKISFKEVPVNIKYTEHSMKKGQSSWNSINIALRMIWNKFFK